MSTPSPRANPSHRSILALLLALMLGAPLFLALGCGGDGSPCGNGTVDSGEACDDGNDDDKDGCTNACELLSWSSGVQQGLAEADIDGWTKCYEDTYGDGNAALATVLGDCDGSQLLLACGEVGQTSYTLAAMAPREDVLFECGSVEDCYRVGNDVGWYFSDSWSWGFLPGGAAPPDRNNCDFMPADASDLRMCWHTESGTLVTGYRCGDNELNDNTWRRVVYTASPEGFCGNGIVEAGEGCDDGDLYDLDGCSSDCQVTLNAAGVQQNVDEAEIESWEFEKCYEDTYADVTGSLATIRSNCDGSQLLLACGEVGSASFTLAAMGRRADVLFDCGESETCVHTGNGVGWYYDQSWSWGFQPATAAPPVRNSCDTEGVDNPDLRMCWHTDGGALDNGYRCGDNNLNTDNGWRRAVFTRR